MLPMPNPLTMSLASTPEIIAELKAGRMVVLVDEEDRENEGDLVHRGRLRHARGDQLHGHGMRAA